MQIPEKSEWPRSVDGTTDWEKLFETEETGLIAIALQCTTPALLKEQSLAIIAAIFTRKSDAPIIAKVSKYLDKLITHDTPQERLPAVQTSTLNMLRKVKDDRIKKAAAYVIKKKLHKDHKKKKSKTNRRANPVFAFFARNNAITAGLIVLLGTLIPLTIYLGSPKPKVGEGNVKEHIIWVNNYIYNHMPQDTWVLQSVKQTKSTQIAISILITDPSHIKAIHSMKRIARVAILNQVCPPAGSGVKDILDLGWTLWVELSGPGEVLTGGTCHYDD